MPKATKQKSGRGRKRAKLLVYPSGHTALELYVACERKAKRTKKKKITGTVRKPQTLYLRLPLMQAYTCLWCR